MTGEVIGAFSGVGILILTTIAQNAKSNKYLGAMSERIIAHDSRLTRIERWLDRRGNTDGREGTNHGKRR